MEMDGSASRPAPDDRLTSSVPDPDATLGSSSGTATPLAESPSGSPKAIGPYRLVRRLGQGGMGQVWLAEQTEPVKRTVALKLIKVGLYDDEVLQRFRAERQSLAMMDHPAIAKVFDAGATPDGQPYFVMEFVPGVPITDFCDNKCLTIKQRLELFIRVCEGVEHAHQKAIIHRDLKPANILVTEVDGKPVPRIIDFGLAKASGPQISDETMMTQAGHWLGTPGYMSPEQAAGSADVDTRTDVYSLGVVLYVLLTGDQPFDRSQWKAQPFYEVWRQLRELDPPSPSTKVRTNAKRSQSGAEAPGMKVAQLAKLLDGDLDWITLKAIEKDRTRRYSTPGEIAADISRYLSDEPVLARRASTGYRARKYVRRHRIAVGVGALISCVLVVFAIAQAVQLRRVQRERDRANRVTEFMVGMFAVVDPSEARGNTVTAREILDRASSDIEKGLAQDPELRGQLMNSMGRVYSGLGLYSRAHALMQRAIDTESRVLGPESPETLRSRGYFSDILSSEGHDGDSEKVAREVLSADRRVFGPTARETLSMTMSVAGAVRSRGYYDECEKMSRDLLALERRYLKPDDTLIISTADTLAMCLHDQRRYQEAESLYRESLANARRTQGADSPITLTVLRYLVWTLQAERRFREAEQLQREGLAIETRVLGPDHPRTLRSKDILGRTLRNEGRYSEAEEVHRQALAAWIRTLGPNHPDTVWSKELLGLVLSHEGKYREAKSLFQQAIASAARGQLQSMHGLAWYNFACAAAIAGQAEDAFPALQQALVLRYATAEMIVGDTDLNSLHSDVRYARLLANLRDQGSTASPRP